MKSFFSLIVILAILCSCAPSQEQIEKAIQETQTAEGRLNTSTPVETNTPLPTDTPTAANTPKLTNTPKRTNTPQPTKTQSRGNFRNPFPFGATTHLVATGKDGEGKFTIKVEEVIGETKPGQ